MKTVLPTNNEAWGFWGTIRHRADPAEAWPVAFKAIATATGCADEGVRDFLDSRFGRHFADEVANHLFTGHGLQRAIEAAISRWTGWTTGRQEQRDYGIPRGLPYLTGFVTHFEIMAEADA